MGKGNNPYRRRATASSSRSGPGARKTAEAALALLGAAAAGSGFLESAPARPWALAFFFLTAGVGLWAICRPFQEDGRDRIPEFPTGSLLLAVSSWMLYRLLQAPAPQAILLPAAFCAWLAAAHPWRATLAPLALIIAMELALTLIGERQSPVQAGLNLAGYGAVALALLLFARSQVYRKRVRRAASRARQKEAARNYGQDLGLAAEEPLEPFEQPPGGLSTVESITASFNLQLEMLRQAIGLTTAAILWPDAEGSELHLRQFASARQDLLPGPFAAGAGIAGVLFRTGEEVGFAPVTAEYAGLPYYRKGSGVGGVFALRIPAMVSDEQEGFPILCVDRAARTAWSETEQEILRLTARKLALEVDIGRRLESTDRERQAIHRLCLGLRELNGALGLEATCVATMNAIRVLVQADLAAISLVEGDRHRVVHAEGKEAGRFAGLEFPLQEGLVGQVLKLNRALPASGSYPGAAPVFSREHRLSACGSLLVIPLRKDEGNPIGALTVAAKIPEAFTATCQQVLELIATQVAIKIDLAQAHERINNMAATDGLTGLANHRAFQNGLDAMLSRAGRHRSQLCLILCDLDHFKQLNDKYGHPFGDRVLQGVAEILAGTVRKEDLAARYGGEEFAILLAETGGKNGLQVAERIRKKVESLNLWQQEERISLTMSLGMVVFPDHGTEKSLLIKRADQALYRSKTAGRNRTTLWAESLPPES